MTVLQWSPFVLACCFTFGSTTGYGATPVFDIRDADGKVLIAAEQIQSYDWATHTLTLAPKVREALATQLRNSKRLASGVPFAVTLDGKTIYKGNFTSVVSSKSFDTPLILVDGPSFDPKLDQDQLQIQLGYPSAQFFKGDDPRSDTRIREALKAASKIGESDNTKWIAKSLREIQTIKPGMTREGLLKVFEAEGGISSRTTQRFAYRACPYIKVDVTFEPVGKPDDKRTKELKDKVSKISKPFLEAPILD
jgi:hypothetical protein